MERRAVLLIALAAAAAPGCLCSAVIDPDPALLGGEGEADAGVSCDDGIGCTFDERNEDGECTHEPDDLICGEGRLCFPSAGCIPLRPCAHDEDCADGNQCTTDRCERDRRACEPAEVVDCANDSFCDGDEWCSPLEGCRPPPAPRDCRDAVDCTEDSCDDEVGACLHQAVDSVCQDGRACNGSEVCAVETGCEPGPPACADDGDCAPDSCLEEEGGTARCTSFPDHAQCAWGLLCVDGDGGPYACEEVPCAGDGDCDDGEACNGLETCGEAGFCIAGPGLVCDDGYFCNGAEVCANGACVAGLPPSCDDGVQCTSDRCEALGDKCDHDPDAGACDDLAFCNGAESCTPTGCAPATGFDCEDGSPCTTNTCDEAADDCRSEPTPELCNALDEDCNGLVDDGFDCPMGSSRACTAPCSGAVGIEACGAACGWEGCVVEEDCNGVDDDCDDEIDEGCAACTPDETGTCTTTCSTIGTRVCSAGGSWEACTPPAEVCNGVDDDCNGEVDDGFECALGEDEPGCTTACGTVGLRVCAQDCSWGPCLPPFESCNGADDDCDDEPDEDFACRQGQVSPCETACDTSGLATCTEVCTEGVCEPPAEACNGLDDDCDGDCDETFACCAGTASGRCTSPCNASGIVLCAADCQATDCFVAEACNGIDDDCDDVPDGAPFDCQAYVEVDVCDVAAGVTGLRPCDSTCSWGACCAISEVCDNQVDDDCDGGTDEAGCCATSNDPEVCNGLDDDCDGRCDEDDGCCQGEAGYCRTSCNTIGTRSCGAACSWGACVPPAEICDNVVDDDCDGEIDEAGCT